MIEHDISTDNIDAIIAQLAVAMGVMPSKLRLESWRDVNNLLVIYDSQRNVSEKEDKKIKKQYGRT